MRHRDTFKYILNDNERILWVEKPGKNPFYLTMMPSGLILILVGVFQFFSFGSFFENLFSYAQNAEWSWFEILMASFICFPIWMGLLFPFYIILDYKNVLYAFTDKRIIIRKGAWGADYKTTEYDKISDVTIKMGPIGEKYNTGNLSFVTGTNEKGKPIVQTMYAISDPYRVFKEVKKVMLDIKSDLYYPNNLRPRKNNGYRTVYAPD